MKIKCEVSQHDVWQHWQAVEHTVDPNFRSDIRCKLPSDLTWYLAEIEEKDLNNMFIISSGDWTDISGGTFRVVDVVNGLNIESNHAHTQRISRKITGIIDELNNGDIHDRKLIAVTTSTDLNGHLTFIDGNHRSVAFAKLNTIVGCEIYIGTSPDIINFIWAQKSFSLR